MKRFIALCGIVFVLATMLAVPVGAEQVEPPASTTLVGILTNEYLEMSNGQYFLLRTEDGLDPISLTNGETYYISQYTPPFYAEILLDSFEANEDGIPNNTVFIWDAGGILYNIEVEWSPDGYMLGFYDGLEYQYLGTGSYDSVYTFYIYSSQTGGFYEQGYKDGYADGYEEGYDEGKADGTDEGFDEGYEQGKREGLDEGYDNGYRDGTADSDDNSWRSLFFGVIEAPVNVLMRLFDFEILGFNLTGLITAVFTLSIVLIVIKWVM